MDIVEEINPTSSVVGEKELDSKVDNKTVVDAPTLTERQSPYAYALITQIAQAAQSIVPWGHSPIARDRELRSFWHSESWLASVVYSVTIRNASFAWNIVGSNPEKAPPKNTIRAVEYILNNSDRGGGWQKFIIKTCIDLYTADNGAFWEVIRQRESPTAPVINFAHLDSAKCVRTGNPKYPVIYTTRRGKEIALPHWKVRTIEEMPSPIETAYGLQYSAVTRALMAAEIIQSIATYKLEKVSGNFTKAIDAISGLTQQDIDNAIALAEEQNLNKGLYRYSMPVILPGLDPTSSLSHVHIDLASLPDNFDEDTSFKWYIAQLAAAFGVDYQEIAPLMTGNLGSSQQSEIMHLKTRGKGPALIMGLIEDLINPLIPKNVEFKFLEQDIRSESEKATAKFTRVKARSMQIKSGELTPKAAREMAILEGDLPRWLANQVDKEEVEMFNRENEQDEFGPTQIEQGAETQFEKITASGLQEIRDFISENPYHVVKTMVRKKASEGNPSGTVIARVWSKSLKKIRDNLMGEWFAQRVRFIPEYNYHVTLVHSPLVDDLEFKAAASVLDDLTYTFPFTVSASQLSSFDTENGKAVVLLIDESPLLKLLQEKIYTKFETMGTPLSEYSVPKQWNPHVTLAYIDKNVKFKDQEIEPLQIVVEVPLFTRADYRVEHSQAMEARNSEV